MSEGMSEYYFDYNDRYGVKNNRAWIPVAIILAILFGGWLLWSAADHSRPEISKSLISFSTSDPRNTEIRYTVTRRDSSIKAICVLVARDYDKAIVGQIDDLIPAAAQSTIERRVTIPSRADAVNASVVSCYLK
jgi:hypothetical protein